MIGQQFKSKYFVDNKGKKRKKNQDTLDLGADDSMVDGSLVNFNDRQEESFGLTK